jgi:hypothetical protein
MNEEPSPTPSPTQPPPPIAAAHSSAPPVRPDEPSSAIVPAGAAPDGRLDPGVRELLPALAAYFDQFTKLIRYWRTRRRILEREQLWACTKEELASLRLMEPWPFNLYQSTLSAAPVIVLIALAFFLGEGLKTAPDAGIAAVAVESRGKVWAGRIDAVLSTLVIPLSLGIAAFAAARGSLRRRDVTPENTRRARLAYVYLDGAHGLWSQMFLVAGAALIGAASIAGPDGTFAPLGLLILLPFGLRQAYITNRLIPLRLFKIHGYPTDYPKLFRRSSSRGQWVRYQLWTLVFAGLLLRMLRLGISIISAGLGYLIGHLQLAAQALIS